MNTHFKSALNKITAEDELVKKTEIFLYTKCGNLQQEKTLYFKQRSIKKMKKLLVASFAAILMIGALIGGYLYLQTPVAYVSLDINPSVELGVNALNNVVWAEGVNEDGQAILEEQNIINTNVTDALGQLIDSAAEKEYINDDGTTVVSITAESKNEKKAFDLADIGEQAVNEAMNNNEVTAIVYKDCSDLSMRTEAKELGISPGKFKLIKSVQALDSTITIDQLKDMKVSDIMLKANELITNLNEDNSELTEIQKQAIDNLKNVSKKTRERTRNAAQIQFELSKEEAKSAFEEAKNQAELIRKEAKVRAEELKRQAEALINSTKGMSESEKSAIIAQANELKRQADEMIKTAEKQAEDLIEAAAKLKEEAIEAAEKLKEDAELDYDDDNDGNLQKGKGNKNKDNKGKGNKNKMGEPKSDDIEELESEDDIEEPESEDDIEEPKSEDDVEEPESEDAGYRKQRERV